MTAGGLAVPRQEPGRGNSTGNRFSDGLRRQFRAVVRALTRSTSQPGPKPRRRRNDDSGRGFRTAARVIFGRLGSFLPFHFLNPSWEPFTWLRLWQDEQPFNASFSQDSVHSDPASRSDLSPRL
jgi:hypothetical protein